jgi:hypothetical protein
MPKRKLRIVKDSPPFIGICERCNSQFKDDRLRAVFTAFDAHQGKPMDSSQFEVSRLLGYAFWHSGNREVLWTGGCYLSGG